MYRALLKIVGYEYLDLTQMIRYQLHIEFRTTYDRSPNRMQWNQIWYSIVCVFAVYVHVTRSTYTTIQKFQVSKVFFFFFEWNEYFYSARMH